MKLCEFYVTKFLTENYPAWMFEIRGRKENQFKVKTAIGEFIVEKHMSTDNELSLSVTTRDTPKIFASSLEDLGKSFQRSIDFQKAIGKVDLDFVESNLK